MRATSELVQDKRHFQFGHFIGKLGRDRTHALVQGDLQRPSDYGGVLYIPLGDSDGWKMGFVQELKNVGYDIDAKWAFTV